MGKAESLLSLEIKDISQPFFVIIEGVAAVGKSELAKELKERIHKDTSLSCLHFDTGEMFRSIAFLLHAQGVDLTDFIHQDHAKIIDGLSFLPLKIEVRNDLEQFPKTYFYHDKEEIPENVLYSSEIDALSSQIAGNKAIQKWAYEKRLDVILSSGVDVAIVNGRDTVANGGFDGVAGLRIVLHASDEDRVSRRQTSKRALGEDFRFEEVKDALDKRDRRDVESGVIAFGGNWEIDRTGLTDQELGDLVLQAIQLKKENVGAVVEQADGDLSTRQKGLIAISMIGLNSLYIEPDSIFREAITNDRKIYQALFPFEFFPNEKQLVTAVQY